MLSLRPFLRLAPRSVSRLATKPSITRLTLAKLSPYGVPAARQSLVAFSTTRSRYADTELAAKLESEIQMEKEVRSTDDYPVNIKTFLDEGTFQVKDEEGREQVVLTRSYDDETVRITFSVADLSNIDSEADSTFNERVEFDDEDPSDMDGQSGGANTKGAINQGRTSGGNIKVAPEDSIAPADRPELADEGQGEVGQDGGDEQSFPAHLNVTIFKTASPQKGALQFEVVAQEGGIVIDALHFLPDAALADPSKSEDEWKRSKLYTGPPFSNLDEDLQNLWEAYLEERGVDVRLAEFVPDYIDWKEQKEYLRWLGKLKNLVE